MVRLSPIGAAVGLSSRLPWLLAWIRKLSQRGQRASLSLDICRNTGPCERVCVFVMTFVFWCIQPRSSN